MGCERGDRIRAVMGEQGIDVVVRLGNTNVVYGTGAIWPLADSGRATFEQPVALRTAEQQHVKAGMVLALSAYVCKEGGALYGLHPVFITPTGPDLLFTIPFRVQGAH
jgi:hypothetical protein